jgi:NitT/TauT family transport system substrate-binding protein
MKCSLNSVLAVTVIIGAAVANQSYAAEPFVLMFGQKTATASEARTYFIQKALGFFKEEGLEVTLQPTDGATQEMQLLAAGQGDAGLGAPPAILLARNSGAKVRGMFNSVQDHGTSLAVLANGPIKDPKELKGKKIGVMSMGASRTLDGFAMARAAGLDPKTDIEWLPVGFGVQAALALQRNDVQALALWDLTYADMEANGIPLRFFTFPFQKGIFGYVYVTTDEKLKTRRADLIKVARSGAKASVFLASNVEAATCIFLMESGRWETTADKPKAYAAALAVVTMDRDHSPIVKGAIGTFPVGSWEKVRDYYFSLGVIKDKLPAEEYYVTDPKFYAEANDFDHAKIEAMAKAYPNKCK